MGKQVNFFFTPRDLNDCESKIRALGPVIFLEARSNSQRPNFLENTAVSEMGKTGLGIYIARPDDIHSIRFRPIQEQNNFAVDELRSPVIEMTRCFFDGQKLRRGRLYYDESFYEENGILITKPPAFRDWAKRVLSEAIKGLSKEKVQLAYLGAEASVLWKQGNIDFVI